MRFDSQDFRDWLSEPLHAAGTTQREFARSVGYSESAVSAWVTGDRRVSDRACVAIALYFGMSVNEIRLLAKRERLQSDPHVTTDAREQLVHYTIANAHKLSRKQSEAALRVLSTMLEEDVDVK
jgi:transcriptional regulator with XRE-family HTH domain